MPFGHPFAGYYLPYPDTQYSGLVSTICDDPPIMNWIYVDSNTYEVKFGTRAWADVNFKGPFDCTRQDRRLTLGGWEGFVAVKEGDFWALYFDLDDDRLRSKKHHLGDDPVVIDVVLARNEMRVPKPQPVPTPPEDDKDAQDAGKRAAAGGGEDADAAAHRGCQEGQSSSSQDLELESPEVD